MDNDSLILYDININKTGYRIKNIPIKRITKTKIIKD
jgi:hypothetical protein